MINKHLHKISTSNSFVPNVYSFRLHIESNLSFPKHINERESVISCAAKSGVEFLIVVWSVPQLIMVSIPCHEQPFIWFLGKFAICGGVPKHNSCHRWLRRAARVRYVMRDRDLRFASNYCPTRVDLNKTCLIKRQTELRPSIIG